MTLSSTAFPDHGTIPIRHTGFGADVSPELTVADAPAETASFAVILDDLDVPFRKSFNHWVVWNLPKTDVIPEALPAGASIREPVAACQGVAWGKHVYRGPKPPVFIRKTHRYVFRLYALDCRLDLPETADKKRLAAAMRGHVLAEAVLFGVYGRGHASKNRGTTHDV